MKRVGLAIVLVLVCGCRRRHAPMTYESDTPAPGAGSAAATTAPSGTPGNPLNEPVLPRPSTAAALPDGGTLNNDPRGPRPAEWKPIVDAVMPALQACFDSANLPPGEIPVSMRYTVEPRGETGAVTAKANAPQAVLDCCVRVVSGLKFPPYGGPKVERDLTFTWAKREAQGRATAAAADGGAVPAKAP
jgi:hypothetical protein